MSLKSKAKAYGVMAAASIGVVEVSQVISRYATDPFLRFSNSVVGSPLSNTDIGAAHMTIGFGLYQTLDYFLNREKDADGKVKNSKSRKIGAVVLTAAAGATAYYLGVDYIEPWLRMRNPMTRQVLDDQSVGAAYTALGFWGSMITNMVVSSTVTSYKTTHSGIKKFMRGES